MTVDFTRAYHLGVRVPDVLSAMDEIGSSLGVQWCSVQNVEQTVWLPDSGSVTVPLTFTYSNAGPLHIELLSGASGSIWDGSTNPGAHHVGVWSDDVAKDSRSLIESGWTLVMAQNDPDHGFGAFTYLRPPSGLIVELVWSAIEPMFARWFSGGSLG